jgi:hypothetical protein
MEEIIAQKPFRKKISKKNIPSALIYEVIEGKIIYFRDYQEVLKGNKTLEDITGSSSLQSIIVSCILAFLYETIDKQKYQIATNEAGLHLSKKNNLSADIAIYDKELILKTALNDKYFEIMPLSVIEIDTKADFGEIGTIVDYYSLKTQKMFDFGVEEVIWFFTGSQKTLVAKPNQDWILTDWGKNISILDKYIINLSQIIDNEGFKI